MLDSKSSQFSFSAAGEILWQAKLNNPLPGEAVAKIEKGASALRPEINIIENDVTAKYDQGALKNSLNLWVKTHFAEVLEPLVLLELPIGVEPKDDAVSKIAASIYDGLGIVPRADLEEFIAQLTPETRGDLRAKKIRLGPVLAFVPALNKPAAVKLRAMLWSLYNGRELPAKSPDDGVVSVRIEDAADNKKPCKEYYRSIGYPLYGGRAVRVDMLDRVISCVYDNAEGGKFQARHEMAEWLGCSIEDLYKVLEDMGHVKIYDPADEVKEEVEPKPTDEPKEAKAEVSVDDKAEPKEAKVEAKPKEVVKPELATFRLRKGKAAQGKSFDSAKPKSANKKDFKKKKPVDKKLKPKREKRVMSAEAKVNAEDSPFSILGQLKK